ARKQTPGSEPVPILAMDIHGVRRLSRALWANCSALLRAQAVGPASLMDFEPLARQVSPQWLSNT
ncbi:MAG TPA: hypothetical protein VK604_09850, partial [Bryobacteraceae bacterium]|nr:hypothetical protein [Bryobacteraceae bacterium]